MARVMQLQLQLLVLFFVVVVVGCLKMHKPAER
jgi:hypothetical protein